MRNASLFFTVFLFGCAVGALLNSIYRLSVLNRIKAAFEQELIAKRGTGNEAIEDYGKQSEPFKVTPIPPALSALRPGQPPPGSA
jgi:hypothetical protein